MRARLRRAAGLGGLASTLVVLSLACSSNDAAPADTVGASGGLPRPSGAGGSQERGGAAGSTSAMGGNHAGGAQTGLAGHGAGSTAPSAGGDGRGAGGKVDVGVGGQKGPTHADPAEGGLGGAAADVGSAGHPGMDGGGGAAKDAATPDAGAMDHPHRLLLCDEGNRSVLLVDLDNPNSSVWSTVINDSAKYGDSLRDIQLVGGDRVAASTAKGYVELDLKTGEIKKTVSKFAGVESMRRLPNGNTLLGANVEGGISLQELDSQDAPVEGHQVTFTNYGQLRLMRRTPQGTFLMGAGNKLVEVNWDRQTVWEMTIPGGDWVFQGLHLPDGTIAASSGYGAEILVIDPATKKPLATLGGKQQPDATSLVPNFYAGFQVLPNGHFVVTNWEGHGGGHGGTGVQVMEYDAAGSLVWRWKQNAKLVSSLHGIIVLDGLDTTKLHDDVNGVLAPVAQ